MCSNKCPLAKNKELFETIDARQQSIDILQLHGKVRVLTFPQEHIPRELNELCDSSVTKLYSKNGRLRHIDVFVHMYVARLFLSINDPYPRLLPFFPCFFSVAVVSLLLGSISCFISPRVLRLLTLAILSLLSAPYWPSCYSICLGQRIN